MLALRAVNIDEGSIFDQTLVESLLGVYLY